MTDVPINLHEEEKYSQSNELPLPVVFTGTVKLTAASSVELGRDEQTTGTRKTSPQSRPCVCFVCSWFSKWSARVNPKLYKYVLKMKRMW